MKADFFAANELEEVVRRQANEWKTLSFTKKSKMTNFWSKAVQKLYQKWQTCHPLLHVKKQLKEQKTNTQNLEKTPLSTTNNAAPTHSQEEVKQKISTKN